MRMEAYHYYEFARGPFKNLSSMPIQDAEQILDDLRRRGDVFAGKRPADYLAVRRDLENKAREMFAAKGGKPKKLYPHYMTLGECEWIRTWYKQGCKLRIALDTFDPSILSFTYGDLFPTMRYHDGKPYRGCVYTKAEIMGLIEDYGLPQDWNPDGTKGPERYIEVQVWDDAVIHAHKLRGGDTVP